MDIDNYWGFIRCLIKLYKTITDQVILPFLFLPNLTYNLQLPYLHSLIPLPPAPSVIQSFILSLPYFSSHFLELSLTSLSLFLPVTHCFMLPAASSFSLGLVAIPQVAFFSVLLYCYSLPLHNSFALSFKLYFPFSQMANSLSLPLFHLFNLLPQVLFPHSARDPLRENLDTVSEAGPVHMKVAQWPMKPKSLTL